MAAGLPSLYFVTDHDLNLGRPKLDVVAAALRGGVKLVQYRDKEISDSEFEAEAREALRLCARHGAALIVNDRVAIARRIGAHGAHLGQEDMDPREARALLGPDAILGLSTHNEEEVRAAQELPLTYINIGPVFPTGTKQHLRTLGADEVLRLGALSSLPWTTMGGIKKRHLRELFLRGAHTAALVTEISLAGDVEGRVRELLAELDPWEGGGAATNFPNL